MNGQDVTRIRQQLDMNQTVFAKQFQINLHTLRQWERKNTPLDSAAAAYLSCISGNATMVLECLGAHAFK